MKGGRTVLPEQAILKRVATECLFHLVNKANLVHNLFLVYLFLSVFFQSLHVSDDYVPIITRNNCVYATIGTCYSETSG